MFRNIEVLFTVINLARAKKKKFITDQHAETTPDVNKACWSRDHTLGQSRRRQQRSTWWTSGGIPTALTKLRLPMALARLAALRFFLVSFFRGRLCSFAQMGLSLERVTRPRNTIVTNFFIITLPLFQKSKLRRPKVTAESTSGARIEKKSCRRDVG